MKATNTKALEANTQVYTPEQAKLIAAKQVEANRQYNTNFTSRRQAAEERRQAKRDLEEMGLGL